MNHHYWKACVISIILFIGLVISTGFFVHAQYNLSRMTTFQCHSVSSTIFQSEDGGYVFKGMFQAYTDQLTMSLAMNGEWTIWNTDFYINSSEQVEKVKKEWYDNHMTYHEWAECLIDLNDYTNKRLCVWTDHPKNSMTCSSRYLETTMWFFIGMMSLSLVGCIGGWGLAHYMVKRQLRIRSIHSEINLPDQSSFYTVIDKAKGQTCAICYSDFAERSGSETSVLEDDSSEDDQEWVKLACNHFYHSECITRWFLQKLPKDCPTCRTVVEPNLFD